MLCINPSNKAELHTLRLNVTQKKDDKNEHICLETGYNFKVKFVF